MRRDKKARGDHLRFIVLDGLARPGVLEAPEDHLLFTAYQEIAS
jgi:3-dehydroquinate synthase